MTPRIPQQSPAQTPASPSTEQSSQQEIPVQSGTATETPAPESSQESEPTLRTRDLVWNARVSFGPAANGTDSAAPFAIGNFGSLGDYFHTRVNGSALFAVGDWLRLGPEVSVDHFRGGHDVYGSNLTSIGVGGSLELNLSHLWGNSPVSVFPRAYLDARAGISFGTTTSEHALLEERLGPGLGIGLGADVVSLRFGGMEVSLGIYGGTHVSWDIGDSNLGFNYIEGTLGIRNSDQESVVTPQEIQQCTEASEMVARIQELQGRAEEMRPAYEANRLMVDQLVAGLEGPGQDQALAQRAVEQALEDEGQDAPEVDEFLARVRELYAQALIEQRDVPEEDAQQQAEDMFPDGTQLLEFLTQEPVPATDVNTLLEQAEELRTSGGDEEYCGRLMDILNQVQEEVIDLSKRNGLLRGYIIGALRHQGSGDPVTRYEVMHISFQMRNARFNTSTPYSDSAPDRPPAQRRTRAERGGYQITSEGVNQAINTQLAASGGNPLTEDQLQTIVRGLFPRSAIPGQSGLQNNRTISLAGELARNLGTLVDTTRQPVVIYFEGHTDTRGADDMNLRLSQRRAQVMADMVRALLPASARSEVRFAFRGLGETMPEAPDDQQSLRQSGQIQEWTEAGLSQAARREQTQVHLLLNRRTEIRIFNTDQELQQYVGGRQPQIGLQTFGETGTPGAFTLSATPQTEASASSTQPAVVSTQTDLPAPRAARPRRPRPPRRAESAAAGAQPAAQQAPATPRTGQPPAPSDE